MKRKKEGRHTTDKIHKYDESDFWGCWDCFVQFLGQYSYYWNSMPSADLFFQQRTLFYIGG
jgi:hypothetical protein